MNKRGRRRPLIALLLAIFTLLLAFPYLQDVLVGDVLLNTLQAGIVLSAVAAVSTDGKHTLLVATLGMLSLLSGWMPRSAEHPVLFVIGGLSGVGFYAFAVLMLVIHLLRETDVSLDSLSGALCGYLLLGFLWTEVYDLIEFHHAYSIVWAFSPGARPNWSDLLYFSFMALTTSGYGDISPVTPQSRSVALLETVSGVFYVAVMISRLVGLHVAENHSESRRQRKENAKRKDIPGEAASDV
jgi:voltage-gated potassium channel